MDITIFGSEPGTSARIVVIGATAIVLFAFIAAVARRRRSFWWVSMALITASCACLALGSYFAVRIFASAVGDMAITGGGIASVRFGIWQATQPVLTAAWIALAVVLLACIFVLPRARKELTPVASARRPHAAIFGALAALSLALGVTPVVLFRRAMAFVLWAITPPAHVPSVPQAIATRLHFAATASVSCFVILIVLMLITVFLARRSGPSRFLFALTVSAVVVSLSFSAALLANFHSFSNLHHRGALIGGVPLQ